MNQEMNEIFNGAPDVLKIAAVRNNHSMKRVSKANKQVKLWAEECQNAEKAFQSDSSEFHSLLARWNTETGELEMPEQHPQT